MSRTILEVHVLQTVPPSNLNRDDTGSPKTAVYGGVRRARVSSQAWKRATRNAFKDLLDPAEVGVRTKRVAEIIAKRMVELEPALTEPDATGVAVEIIKAATGVKSEIPKRKVDKAKKAGLDPAEEYTPETSYLMFLSARQLDSLARHGVAGAKDVATYLKDKDVKQAVRDAADTLHSIDIALFGRMVADSTDINVDAAAQVAHAISVHAVDNETDYFTAVDDTAKDDEPGAGMIGTVDFNSATLYRYAAVDVDRLAENLGQGLRDDEPTSEPVRRAVQAFVEGFTMSLPTGKINTFGNHTLPDAVVVKLRTTRPISFVAAFEEPVLAGPNGGYLQGACERLTTFAQDIEEIYGLSEGTQTWVLHVGAATAGLSALGTSVTRTELAEQVGKSVAVRMTSAK